MSDCWILRRLRAYRATRKSYEPFTLMNRPGSRQARTWPASVQDLPWSPIPQDRRATFRPSFSRGTRLHLDMENSCSEHTPMPV